MTLPLHVKHNEIEALYCISNEYNLKALICLLQVSSGPLIKDEASIKWLCPIFVYLYPFSSDGILILGLFQSITPFEQLNPRISYFNHILGC